MPKANENVITSAEVTGKTPKAFKDLNKEQLVEAALLFGTDEEGSTDAIVADLFANNIPWDAYVKSFQLEGHEDLPPLEKILRAAEPVEEPEEETTEVNNVEQVQTISATPVLAQDAKYLIKMTRENPYFEFKKYKFTQQNPYAIMTAADAQKILESEEGFRQAFPSELEEFYS